MKIVTSKYVISAVKPADYPALPFPDFAFLGRSNVGKSSLINRLTQRKKLARTSSVPGKTRYVNFYEINNQFYLVDLPGYGFTKVPESVSRNWRKCIDTYLQQRKNLRVIFHLIDIRRPPTEMDLRVSAWLRSGDVFVQALAVKADKLSKRLQQQNTRKIREDLGLTGPEDVITVSARTGLGRDRVFAIIQRFLEHSGAD